MSGCLQLTAVISVARSFSLVFVIVIVVVFVGREVEVATFGSAQELFIFLCLQVTPGSPQGTICGHRDWKQGRRQCCCDTKTECLTSLTFSYYEQAFIFPD